MRRSIVVVLALALIAVAAPVASGVTRDVSIEGIGAGFSPSALTIDLGDQVRWTNADGIDHTSTQSGPLGLWDAGPIDPGDTFSVVLGVAGTYPYRCNIHSVMTGRVRVRPEASVLGTGSIKVVIASQVAQSGFVFDVQRRDGSGSWELWKDDSTRRSVRFTPPSDGEYAFRARLQREAGGASMWSPAVSVTV